MKLFIIINLKLC